MVINLKAEGKTVKILCVGRKGRDTLKRDYESNIIDTIEGIGKSSVEYTEATDVADRITAMFDEDDFDICTIVFNRFQSAMTQIPTAQQLIPFAAPEAEEEKNGETAPKATDEGPSPIFIFEPEEQDILSELLPRNIGVQIFQALLESAASEHGARMTSMDNATRNAGEMIDKLSIIYNRTRQAAITTELVEIVSGAEALK
jgi:F-type H+-transporting ATPase subunit gamma